MKKIICAFLAAACLMVSGCSAVSEEVYHQMLDSNYDLSHENYSLKSEVERLTAENAEQQRKIAELESDNADLVAEKESLQREIEQLSKDDLNDSASGSSSNISQPSIADGELQAVYDQYKYETITNNGYGTIFCKNTGNTWYAVDSKKSEYVMYVEDNKATSDDEIISYAYADVFAIPIEYPKHNMYSYNWCKKDGTIVCMSFVSFYKISDETQIIGMPLVWMDEYMHLNDNPLNDELAQLFNSTDN